MNLDIIYFITGLLLVVFATMTWLDKQQSHRVGTTLFWLVYGISFMFGSYLPSLVTGLMVVVLTLLAATGQLGKGFYRPREEQAKRDDAQRLGNRLFAPALIIPIVTFAWAKLFGNALVGLGISSIMAWMVALLMTRGRVSDSLQEGRRQIDAIGWTVILSQFLAALGYLFGKADVGAAVSDIVSSLVSVDSKLGTVIAYCLGMALFTAVMGNAFAAFAVITAGVGLPMVILGHGGDAAVVGVLGMLSGYCGTLVTPMAANFNVVPAALLELEDKYQVVKVQVIPAFVVLVANIILMYTLAF